MRDGESNSRPLDRDAPVERLRLDLFGNFRLRRGGQPLAGLDHPRLQFALAYLALHRADPISRQQLAFLFWPDSTDQQALKNLRTLLTRLRQALPEADLFIEVTAQTIRWRSEAPVTLDVAEFEAAIAQAASAQEVGDYTAATNALAGAVVAYTGELLPDCYDDWILPLREQYHQAFSGVLDRLVLLLEEHRDYDRALPHARRLLNHDPLREIAYHHLIRLHLALGDRAEALRVCQTCDSMLEQEFGIALTRATRKQYERLLEAEGRSALVAVAQPPDKPASRQPLVGRDAEWSRLMVAWHAAANGHPQMVLLSGEAGIGKTRLAEELCAWVARQGVTVAAAHCYPAAGDAVTYAPVVEWLRDREFQTRLAALDDVWLVEVSRILPALLVNRPHLKSPGPLSEAWQRTRLFEALARAVLGPDDLAPLLLFLDDLQWCDQETLDWLGYLLRYAVRAPLLVVASVRKYEINRLHPLMAFWLALTRSSLLSEISLEPLDAADTALLAANVAGRDLDAGEATQIWRDTEGYPLFIVEMMQSGMENTASRSIPSTPATLPLKVRAVIQWRLAQLSPAARALAQTAAVIGRKFSFEMLARVSGQNEAPIIDALDELWQRNLVRSQGDVYDFSHDGIRTVAYEDIAPLRRRALHLHVAQALEDLHQDDLDAFSSQIAGHFEQAGQVQPAIAYYRQAASVAERVYANAAAAQFYQRLLEGELSAGLSAPGRCAVMLALADVWRITGQWAQAETINRRALAAAEAMGDIRLVAQARRALADTLRLLGYYAAALKLLAEAERGFRSISEWSGVADTLRITGQIHWLRGDHSQALAALEQQLEISTGIDDPRRICEARQVIGIVLWSQGDWEQAADNCLKSILVAGPLEYKPVITRASITLGNIRSGEHWFGEAVYWYQRAGALAREIDDRQALSWVITSIAHILAKRGDYTGASAGYERSLHTAWEIGDRLLASLNVANLAAVNRHLGRLDEAESLYRQAIDFGRRLYIPGYLSGMLVGLASLLFALGRTGEAYSVYEDALTQISGVAGERLVGEDTRFEAQVLGIRLRHELGKLTKTQAIAALRAILLSENSPSRQAILYFELWRLAPDDAAARTAAAARYHAEYTATGAEEFRKRYTELTGENLLDPPPLPDVSDLIPDQREALSLAQILVELNASFE